MSPALAFVVAVIVSGSLGAAIHVWIYNDGNPRWIAATVGAIVGFSAGLNIYSLLERL